MIFDKYAYSSQELESKIQCLLDAKQELQAVSGGNRSGNKQKETAAKHAIEQLLKESQPHLIYHELHLLDKSAADEFRNEWALSKESKELRGISSKAVWKAVEKPQIDLDILPPYSVFIQFRFTLAKPYLSRDENLFYIIDNPVRKEKVFTRSHIAASSWKGSLRAALWQIGYNEDNEKVRRLFGNERGVELQEQLRSGRLYFYPTFFDKVSLEVINPHDRKKRVGKNPILFECVPEGTSGYFTLLYIPFDLIGKGSAKIKKQAADDLKLTCNGLCKMLTVYGFGAKTSSGFGMAQDDITEACIKTDKKRLNTTQDNPVKLFNLAKRIGKLFKDENDD